MKTVKAEILTIGDEILYGQILDSNSQWISQELDQLGIKVVRKTTVGDNEQDMLAAFQSAMSDVDIVLITGGLGPTNDDLTKPVLAKFFNTELQLHSDSYHEIEELFASKGRELTETNKEQAVLPIACLPISNKLGSAPGMWFDEDDTVFVSMPGVPFEMKRMMLDSILPKIVERFHTPVIYHKVVKTTGIGESWLSDKIQSWEQALPDHIKLAYLPSLMQVKLRLTAVGTDRDRLIEEVEEQIDKLKPLAQKYIYGYNSDTLEKVVGDMLRERSLTLSAAESCTGGNLAHLITSIPGSSDYFLGGVVSYHNDVKTKTLGVSPDTIEKHGAVSEETVVEMARGVKKLTGSSIGVSTSGVAGPGGGTDDKPVGTVWIACVTDNSVKTKRLSLSTERDINIQGASLAVLNMVRIVLNAE